MSKDTKRKQIDRMANKLRAKGMYTLSDAAAGTDADVITATCIAALSAQLCSSCDGHGKVNGDECPCCEGWG